MSRRINSSLIDEEVTRIAFVVAANWVFIGFHAAVFAAVVVVVLAIQWLLDRSGSGKR